MKNLNIEKAILIIGTQKKMGEAIGVSQAAVQKWLHGLNPVSPKFVLPIEKATKGQITRHELRPDIYPLE